MKRTFLLTTSLFARLFLVAQTQYDYMDDDAVAGGADRVLNWILVITGLIILGIIIMIFIGFALKIYYWFNPQADPDYVKVKRIKEKEREEKKKEETIIAQKRKDAVVEAIDLGLSVKWASFNLGAYKASDIGEKFCWTNNLSKAYKPDGKINVNALGDISGIPEYDVATKRLGNKWRMPTDKECRELIDLCSWETKIIDNIEGRLVTGPSGRSIFLPLNQMDYITRNLITGHYWSSCPSFSNFEESAQDLRFGEGCKKPAEFWHAGIGSLFCIRPVFSDNHKTKEEKEADILHAFLQIKNTKDNKFDSLYENYEKQCLIRENEINPNRMYDGKKVKEQNTFIDEYGVVYSKDRKRLLDGGNCSCEVYEIKEGTEFICNGAFSKSYTIYDSIDNKNRVLKRIILPSSLLYLSEYSICDNCEIESKNKYYTIIDKLVIDKRKKRVIKCLDKYITEVVIGAPIEEIGKDVFINCRVLQKVTLPDTLKVIDKRAFRNDEFLKMINLPDTIEKIEDDAFWGCRSLYINKLPKNLKRIGDSAFSWCIMNNVIISDCIQSIGNAPFPVKCINIHSLSERFVIENGLLIDKLNRTLIQFIDSSASNVEIPQNLRKIESNAFHHCDIEQINIPSNIEEIGFAIFWGCKNLSKITFECNISSIPAKTFAYCKSLVSVNIPCSVIVIEAAAFDNCENLKNVNLSYGIKVVSNNTFINCHSLQSLNIPETVEILGKDYSSCFRNCCNLKEFYYDAKNAIVYGIPGTIDIFNIGEHVEILPCNLIPCDSNIKTLTIPENVRKISKGCIWGGSKLKEIIILSRNIVLEDGWLMNCENLERIMLHKDMYETLLPHLPCRENLKITKIYSHHFLFFKW